MLLSEFENKIKNKLNEFDLKEVFPYKENGVLGEVNTFEEVVRGTVKLRKIQK